MREGEIEIEAGGYYGSFMTSTCHPVNITSLTPHTLSFFSIHVSDEASSG